MIWLRAALLGGLALLAATESAYAQQSGGTEVQINLTVQGPQARHPLPAVVWLSPSPGTPALPFRAQGEYTLLQKDRTFKPHLQVVPVGAVVQFPNADPFFHNVFSLFDGKRFDLGLYEAGSTKAVTFPREGVSYIFCDIHPEMSAVILTLSTPLYATGKTGAPLVIHGVPSGDYDLNLWVEGVRRQILAASRRHLHIEKGGLDQEQIALDITAIATSHKDKFGKDYPIETNTPY